MTEKEITKKIRQEEKRHKKEMKNLLRKNAFIKKTVKDLTDNNIFLKIDIIFDVMRKESILFPLVEENLDIQLIDSDTNKIVNLLEEDEVLLSLVFTPNEYCYLDFYKESREDKIPKDFPEILIEVLRDYTRYWFNQEGESFESSV